ncbi:hypothetical protein TNIN_375721 [Trichonephila inaurata madagascariensis]|uniref:Uncharacterized protein n=1 Tax=Trichonephila inaurata madagascariensis TaxID=2747483 RepID=A0A8X6XNH9_9ARAC|nr:hypothetical protein TNIN_375721 [Trichonephila inaurata madagascariensis]
MANRERNVTNFILKRMHVGVPSLPPDIGGAREDQQPIEEDQQPILIVSERPESKLVIWQASHFISYISHGKSGNLSKMFKVCEIYPDFVGMGYKS